LRQLANINLVAQILMALVLLAGMILARRRLFRAHGICQSTVVILNLIPITTFMLPVFERTVRPNIASGFGDTLYLAPILHGTVGVAAEVLGLFIVIRAGTNLLPARLRFKNYKRWMRAELALWWLALLLGLWTYANWHQGRSAILGTPAKATQQSPGSSPSQALRNASTVMVVMNNFAFEPKELNIEIGSVVVWKDAVGRHSVSADDGSFESEVLAVGGEFRQVFERVGRVPYHCTLHGEAGGHDMAGTINVAPRANP
jgi:plastocyanin/uncharacterized membrane protein YozB (DUF420 family)